MDGDDRCDSKRFEKEIEILDKCSDIAIVSSDMEFFDEKGVWGKISHPQFPEFLDFVHESPFCHAACMVRKEAYLKVMFERLLLEKIEELWEREDIDHEEKCS